MSPQSNSEQCRDSREQPKRLGACLYSFHLYLSSSLQQFLWLCVLRRGHSLLPFTFRFRHRKRCFAVLDFSVELHTNFIPLNVFGYPPLSATASATRLTLERSSKEKYGPIVRTSEGASSMSRLWMDLSWDRPLVLLPANLPD